jgi:type IV pilus assembly protein PilE
MKALKRIAAFTLNELMVVLIIIGILVLIALPNLMPLITNARATEAKLQLKHIQLLESTYFLTNSKYSSDLNELGFDQQKLVKDGGEANYKVEILSATNNSFKARATSTVDFNQNGLFDTWEIDQDKNLKEVQKD